MSSRFVPRSAGIYTDRSIDLYETRSRCGFGSVAYIVTARRSCDTRTIIQRRNFSTVKLPELEYPARSVHYHLATLGIAARVLHVRTKDHVPKVIHEKKVEHAGRQRCKRSGSGESVQPASVPEIDRAFRDQMRDGRAR